MTVQEANNLFQTSPLCEWTVGQLNDVADALCELFKTRDADGRETVSSKIKQIADEMMARKLYHDEESGNTILSIGWVYQWQYWYTDCAKMLMAIIDSEHTSNALKYYALTNLLAPLPELVEPETAHTIGTKLDAYFRMKARLKRELGEG